MPKEVMPRPRLLWRRTRPGKYVAGPYVVTRLPMHRAIWACTRFHIDTPKDLGHYNTAADGKQAAADDYVKGRQ